MVTITIQSLVKRFGGTTVLHGIDLQIKAGELFFLLGPSGCGKTTLLRHIAGFYTPDAGRIYFDEQDVTRIPPHARDTGMMFQSYALWPHLSVAQNVAFGLEERRISRADIDRRVDEALDMVQLSGLGERRIQQLSGGQQQRVALARALVIKPKVFLLDEPLSNLDAKLRVEMRREIRAICKDHGLTGIYVTHDREEALSMGDRLAVMHAGHLVQVGAPMDVYKSPTNRMVAEFMGETNIIEGTLLRDTSRTGLYDVETTLGVLRGRPFDPSFIPVRGQPVQVSIRPEALSFYEVPDSPNRLAGRVLDTMYLGSMVQYRLQVGTSSPLAVCDLNPELILQPGEQEARVMCSPRDVVILRK
jgi:iron(III) transport system ATP-binding protein